MGLADRYLGVSGGSAEGFPATDRFELQARLGAGGMGVVFAALDRRRGAPVALKTLLRMSPEALLRFKNEFRALEGLSHPNLVQLYELVEDAGHWFFTMELLQGMDWVSYVRGAHAEPATRSTVSAIGATAPALGVPSWPVETPSPDRRTRVEPVAYDEKRLRAAMTQLARGLGAIHRAGKVHRDVKPSNVLVTREGRVVLLDFGLVADADSARGETRPVGTVAYMAPEQAAGATVGPAADLYAVGAVLYRALTGRDAFEGETLEVLSRKQTTDPLPPRSLVPEVPEDLDELCMQLLHRDPDVRPGSDDVLARLDERAARREAAGGVRRPSSGPIPAGALREAFEDVRRGRSVSLLVRGAAGSGKSALLSRFADDVQASALVLRGGCREREHVSYKAVDGVVDALTDFVGREAAELVPSRLDLLARVFPVTASLGELRASRPPETIADARELRARVFLALRDWLVRVADEHDVVLLIDDLQWADPDSRAMLDAVMRPPESPRLLLVATERPEQDGRRHAHPPWGDVRVLDLEPVRRAPRGADRAAVEGVGARIDRLEPEARRVLEVLATAAGPLPIAVVAGATRMRELALGQVVETLRLANLVRTSAKRDSYRIEPLGAPVVEAMRTRLGSEETLHRAIATALEELQPTDTELLAIHWQHAGDRQRALAAAESAAKEAEAVLAFERAAELWQRVLELSSETGEARRGYLVRRAVSLANAGRGIEAARLHLAAADGAPPAEALERRRIASELFLNGGAIDEGLETLRAVLRTHGMSLTRTPWGAAAALVARELQLRMRGYEAGSPSRSRPQDAARADACRTVARGLGFVDNIRAAHFQAQHMLLALRTGDAARIAEAASMHAPFVAAMGPRSWPEAAKLGRMASTLARRSGEPRLVGMARFAVGFSALQQGRWRSARRCIGLAETLFRERCTGLHWELDTSQNALLWALFYLGELHEMRTRTLLFLREAFDRHDLYASTNLRLGPPSVAWLVRDELDECRRAQERALHEWPKGAFCAQDAFSLIAASLSDLYADEPASANDRLRSAWTPLSRSLLLQNQLLRIQLLHLRGASAVGASRERSGERGKLWAAAERDASRLRAERTPWATALSAVLLAAVADARGDEERASDALEEAARGFAKVDMPIHAAAANARRGAVLGGDSGLALARAAVATIAAQKVSKPERIVAMLAPGFRS